MNVRVGKVVSCLVAVSCGRGASHAAAADMPAEASCAFVQIAAHPDPVPLIEEFVARDARGEFTRTNAWFTEAVDCPGHEGGPDEVTVATAHAVRIVARGRDSVTAEVTWQRVGYLG